MKNTKQIIGIILIIAAVASLVYWEKDGRNRVMTTKVLVAGENIMKGEIITRQMLSVVSSMPETVVAGALTPDEINKVEGKETMQPIAKNQQIIESLLYEPEEKAKDKLSPFLIKGGWIDSRSSSLRRGDVIELYSRDGGKSFGVFEVVFVKDSTDKEIIDINGGESRVHGSGIIDHIEILTDLEEYKEILHFIDSGEDKLLIVQRGDG